MSSIVGPSITRIDIETQYDPNQGISVRETWRGTQAACNSLASNMVALGHRASVANQGGFFYTYITLGGQLEPPDPEIPTNKWTIQKDYVQESLWVNKKITDLIEDLAAVDSIDFSDALAMIRRETENALKGKKFSVSESAYVDFTTGPINPSDTGFYYPMLDIYKQMLLGMEGYETERIVITRTRTFTVGYVSRLVMSATPIVYSTAALVAAYGIPTIVQAVLPATPANKPENTEWAWKVRRDTQDITWDGKVEEVRDFVFAPWSTLTHDYITI